METEMKSPRCRYLLAMAVCFSFGMVFGLLCHLPTVSFQDDSDFPSASESRWRTGESRLNGRPIGLQKRSLSQNAIERSVTVSTRRVLPRPTVKPAARLIVQPTSQDIVEEGVFWSRELESSVPKGFTDDDLNKWRRFAHENKVVNVEEGCGRMQNRIITFEDGTKSCARYRINTDQIQGEVYSFYLARLIGIDNIPPLVMASVDQRSTQWKGVGDQVNEARWSDEKPIVMAQFVNNLVPAFIPANLRQDDRKVASNDELRTKSRKELVELVQWSDLIVLDYLTGNLDRVVNNMFNLQWNDEIMNGPAHNLEKSGDFLLFLDNESGLFHGYRLLDKYQTYHEQLLKSLCIFRRSTVAKLKSYYDSGLIGDDLHRSVAKFEKYGSLLPSIPEKNLKVLRERIGHVLEQVSSCQNRR